MKVEIVVVGAGVVGSSIAYYLAREGMNVLLIDRARFVSTATASGASAGGIGQTGREPPELPLAVESLGIWSDLGAELELDLEYHRTGRINCVDTPDQVSRLVERVNMYVAHGIEAYVLTGEEVYRLVPGVSRRIIAATYCPTDGYANPLRTARAFSLGVSRHAGKVIWGKPVIRLRLAGGRIIGVDTPKETIWCDTTILASGAWTHHIAASSGFMFSIFKEGFLQMMVTLKHRHLLDQVLGWIGKGISLKQLPNGSFLIGGGWPGFGDVEKYQTGLLPASMAKSAAIAVDLFPRLGYLPLIRAWVGAELFTKDNFPVISYVPEVSGLFIAAGFSGRGLAIAPSVGRNVAKWVATGRQPELLKPFDIRRFPGQGTQN
jgi:sarcosine oxidase subunit beta